VASGARAVQITRTERFEDLNVVNNLTLTVDEWGIGGSLDNVLQGRGTEQLALGHVHLMRIRSGSHNATHALSDGGLIGIIGIEELGHNVLPVVFSQIGSDRLQYLILGACILDVGTINVASAPANAWPLNELLLAGLFQFG
jgi:hypothetical protein